MSDSQFTYIPRYFTQKGIAVFLGVTILMLLLFIQRIVPVQWVFFNVVEVLLFFGLSSKLSMRWSKTSTTSFEKNLFKTSFFIRLVWVIFSYFYYSWMTGKPFEFEAADSTGYHVEAIWLSGLLKANEWYVYKAYIGKNYSDMGYPFYLGILYYVIGENVLIPRLIKAFLGAYTCIFIYKIARNNFSESVGRIAGIMAMLVPNLIYYTGLHVKETEMVFLVVCFIYLADKLNRGRKISFSSMFWVLLIGASLFFFRTVLAACLVGSVGLAVFFTSHKVSSFGKRIGVIVVLVIGIILIASTPLVNSINEYLKASDQNLNSQMDNFATRDGANKLARYGSRGIFLPFMLMAPFPTLVYVADQSNAMMLAGAYFTRNIYAFFVFIGLFALYKRRQLREHVLLLAFMLSYIFVLASSGFALSERFHLPLVPFLLVFAAYGVSQLNNRNKKYYIPYLALVTLIIVGWNWFKVAGRS
ncbi:glycosyltransferase family 39 protein [Spirosoma fluviale]|uniref:Dolichyl-phosphate-mannose-protein mannosyltransferase n=1 Tax=Spirosoma fluviale TaxID=1597977 RepID=A0A286FDE0_9BACT|nr:glycosyltransferase family 39 protein [Spirosoma fluviale]SOD81248.1 Dolichyl-phosphate-mannose-protein mannosyltransferase [Spirosoma fluviale]